MVVFGITFGLMDLDSKLEEPTISDAITLDMLLQTVLNAENTENG